MSFFWGYLILINIVTFVLRGIDKRKAIAQKRRISEDNLLLLVTAGGSVGALFGQQIFKHKTIKQAFVWKLYLILLIQIILIVWWMMRN